MPVPILLKNLTNVTLRSAAKQLAKACKHDDAYEGSVSFNFDGYEIEFRFSAARPGALLPSKTETEALAKVVEMNEKPKKTKGSKGQG
jgi:hypothetical protein